MRLVDSHSLRDLKPAFRKEVGELQSWIDDTPEFCTVKGMYVTGILQALDNFGIEHPDLRVQAFKDYPLRDYMVLLLNAALTMHPGQAPKEGLRLLGQLAVPTFAYSLVGAVITSTVGRNWEMGLKFVSRGYELSLKPGTAVVAELADGRALVELRDVWNFGDSYQVGVMEGLMSACDVQGTVTAKSTSRCDVDLHLEWEARGARRARQSASDRAQAD